MEISAQCIFDIVIGIIALYAAIVNTIALFWINASNRLEKGPRHIPPLEKKGKKK